MAWEVAVAPVIGTADPMLFPSAANWTVPLSGVGVMVAVNVTDWPEFEGFCEDVTWVEVDVC